MMKNHEELSQIKLAAVEGWCRTPHSWGTLGALETSGPCARCGYQWAAGGESGAADRGPAGDSTCQVLGGT